MAKMTAEEVYALILEKAPLAFAAHPVASPPLFARWMLAIIYVESGLNPKAKGYAKTPSGWALGLTQVTTGTKKDIEKHYKWPIRSDDALYEAPYSVLVGCANFAWLLQRNKGDYFAATYKYNQGAYASIKTSSYGNTYYAKVKQKYESIDFVALEKSMNASLPAAAGILNEMREEFI